MTCSRCGARATVDRARYCAGCLLAAADADADAPILSADEVAPCELLSIMGDSARAVTFLAEQTWPVRRLVAFKVFKTDMRQPELPRHPHIAPVLERGRVGGRVYTMTPYFGGGSLIALCERHRLDTSARLTALLAVTGAVAAAHAHGVAHGRIQPSNVLCDPQAPFLVQIVDFARPEPAASGESLDALVRADLEGLIALADALLHSARGHGLDVPATLQRLRVSAGSAADLEKAFVDVQAGIGR
jgi:eukaryotic-like serine/threonine-protein kinase